MVCFCIKNLKKVVADTLRRPDDAQLERILQNRILCNAATVLKIRLVVGKPSENKPRDDGANDWCDPEHP
jgi:hypothetical protein